MRDSLFCTALVITEADGKGHGESQVLMDRTDALSGAWD